MTLTDLMNHHYANVVREGMIDLTLGRSDHEVKIGDIVEMLLSISFAVKDAMLEWEYSLTQLSLRFRSYSVRHSLPGLCK